MTHPAHFGVRVSTGFKAVTGGDPVRDQRTIWTILDEGGVDGIWTMDHMGDWREDQPYPVFDGWTVLAMIAASTSHARLVVEVTGVPYRYPGVLAKSATTIDHYSGGRLEMGLGAGSGEREFRQLGIPFGAPRDRIRALDEA